MLFNKDKNLLIHYTAGSNTTYTIPESTVKIETYAFVNNPFLNQINITHNVKEIGIRAFSGCTALTSVELPDNVTIGSSAFSSCESLETIKIPASTINVEPWAFQDSPLKKIYYLADNPIEGDENIFGCSNIEYDIFSEATLYVSQSGYNKIIETEPWKNFSNIKIYDESGIEHITTEIDWNKPYHIYNLNGIKMIEDINILPSGIYIIHQDYKSIKRVIK